MTARVTIKDMGKYICKEKAGVAILKLDTGDPRQIIQVDNFILAEGRLHNEDVMITNPIWLQTLKYMKQELFEIQG